MAQIEKLKNPTEIKNIFVKFFGIDEYEIFKCEFDETIPSLILKYNKKIIGFLILNKFSNNEKKINYYYISQLCVLEKYQRQGYATMMIKQVQETAEYLELDTFEENIAAINTYIKCGFVKQCRYFINDENKKVVLDDKCIIDKNKNCEIVNTLVWYRIK